MLKKAFGDDAMLRPRVYEWNKRFRKERENVEDDARSGRPSIPITDENVEKIEAVVLANRRLAELLKK